MNESEQDKRETADAYSLIEHPGWGTFLKDVIKETKAARGRLLSGNESTIDQRDYARGSFNVLRNLVLAVYRRANIEPPPNIKALFE